MHAIEEPNDETLNAMIVNGRAHMQRREQLSPSEEHELQRIIRYVNLCRTSAAAGFAAYSTEDYAAIDGFLAVANPPVAADKDAAAAAAAAATAAAPRKRTALARLLRIRA